MNIYFAGSTFKGLNDWIQQNGFNKLFSQENDRREIANWVAHKRANKENSSKLFIDSGAFSAHTKGVEIDVDEYIDYLNKNEDALTIYAQVDKIPGEFGKPKTPEQIAEAPKMSWDNYLYMAPKLKNKDKLVPIFHQHEDFKWLKNMLEYVDENGKHIPYIGISPANDVSVKNKKEWLVEVFDIIKQSSNPNVHTHAFGMTSLNLLEAFPFTSADSTSWLMTAVTGSIFSQYGTITISEQTQGKDKNFKNLPEQSQKNLIAYIESKGFTLEGLQQDYKQRQYFNITYLADWASNYKYKGSSLIQKPLFED